MQKGGDAAELEAKKRDLEAKRAAAANRGVKTFYKVTVEVRAHIMLTSTSPGLSTCACDLHVTLACGKIKASKSFLVVRDYL